MKEPVILCVDDEELVLKALKRELGKFFGDKYLIETSDGGEDALSLFQELLDEENEVPLVISDHIMPDIKGDELLQRIHELSPKTLTIMLTGQADMEAVTNAVNRANLYRYIAKPWEATDLELTIKEAMRRYFQDKALQNQMKLLRNMNATLEEKVKKRTTQLEAQQIELQQLNASKDKFFSVVADDLRAPFTGLLGLTDFMVKNVEKFTREQIKEQVGSMREATENVYTLLENLLAWSQLQQGKLEYHSQEILLQEITERNTTFFASNAAQKQITVSNQISPEIKVSADRTMLMIIIRNLLSNALKFTNPGGVVALEAVQDEKYVDLNFSDTGVGISKDVLPQLFRIDAKYSTPGTADEEGTGLGLIVCKTLIEQNKGRLRLQSEVKQGTVVTVRLPAARN